MPDPHTMQAQTGSTHHTAGHAARLHDGGARPQIDATAHGANSPGLAQLLCAVENSASAVCVTDITSRIEYVNPRFCELNGYQAHELIGRTPAMLRSGRTPRDVHRALWDALCAGEDWRGELLNRRKDGSIYWCRQSIVVVRDSNGQPVNFVAVSEDVSEHHTTDGKLHHLAHFDMLTGLPNRRHFFEKVAAQLVGPEGAEQDFAILHFDLFEFKHVNDSLGHAAGDELLVEVGSRIRACLKPGDFLARMGGDEFAVLVPGGGQPDVAARLTEKIFDEVERPFALAGSEAFVSSSMGVSLYPADGRDAATLIRNADMALYRAKAKGKHALVYFSSDLERLNRERAGIERELRHAIERGELSLEYQPKYHLGFDRIVGAEALLRWTHPVLGRVSPANFIPIAEESLLIIPIGKWVIEEVCRQISRWQEAGMPPVQVALNLSAVQFRSRHLFDEICGILEASDVLPGQIELEITESLLMDDPDAAIGLLNQLHRAGFSIAIDDFGTGYSSLSYLKKFPVGVLKIDRSFVKDLCEDMDDRAIASAIVGMANALLLDVVAEGVESIEQVDLLREMGCDYIQGYYISKPLAPAAFLHFVQVSHEHGVEVARVEALETALRGARSGGGATVGLALPAA